MKLFAINCRDGEGSAELRQKYFAEHLANVEAAIDSIAVAGPLKEGEQTVGSLFIVKVENKAAARAIVEADPYFAAGVWRAIEVDEFLGVAGDWVGGKTW